jgi:hypothetical protein
MHGLQLFVARSGNISLRDMGGLRRLLRATTRTSKLFESNVATGCASEAAPGQRRLYAGGRPHVCFSAICGSGLSHSIDSSVRASNAGGIAMPRRLGSLEIDEKPELRRCPRCRVDVRENYFACTNASGRLISISTNAIGCSEPFITSCSMPAGRW